jgi:hypothetical protein
VIQKLLDDGEFPLLPWFRRFRVAVEQEFGHSRIL